MALPTLTRSNYSDYFLSQLDLARLPNLQVTRLSGSRLVVSFEQANTTYRYRVIFFAVSGTGRARSLERRLEITSTYVGGNLQIQPGCTDLIVAIERASGRMIGIDARRLGTGGATHNASTFVYLPALESLNVVTYFAFPNSRQKLFKSEYQIYFRSSFASDYLLNASALHSSGLVQAPQPLPVNVSVDTLVGAPSAGNTQQLSYEQQVSLALRKMEIGRAGEALVLRLEKERLESSGRQDLASAVEWVSQQQPFLGYDIKSFSVAGDELAIEVKSCVGSLKTFFLTENEYRRAQERGEDYSIACVSNVFGRARVKMLSNPADQIAVGTLKMCPTTYRISF